MPIRTVCPTCSTALAAPETAAGKILRCPKCHAALTIPFTRTPAPPAAGHEEDYMHRRGAEPDEDRRRPRLGSRRARRRRGGLPLWLKAVAAILAAVVCGLGGFLAVQRLVGPKDQRLAAADDATKVAAAHEGHGRSPSDGAGRESGTVKYIPRVSEQKLSRFLDGHEPREVTEDQVYAIMGEPTGRDPPVTGHKNGQLITAYTAYWEVPGSGVSSKIVFANGRIGGMILGLEITPPRAERVTPDGGK
jgi:hypothetical protein